jgi:acyl carrier protein
MTTPEIGGSVRDFIKKNFVVDKRRTLGDDDSLIGNGIVDSTGILELINFIEEKFGLQFEDEELVPENSDSVTKITGFLSKKLLGKSAATTTEGGLGSL